MNQSTNLSRRFGEESSSRPTWSRKADFLLYCFVARPCLRAMWAEKLSLGGCLNLINRPCCDFCSRLFLARWPFVLAGQICLSSVTFVLKLERERLEIGDLFRPENFSGTFGSRRAQISLPWLKRLFLPIFMMLERRFLPFGLVI